MKKIKDFQSLIFTLKKYWAHQGCTIIEPFDIEIGAGTFHPMTFLSAIGPEPVALAYVQASRRPTDGRYGKNPNRLQHYYQFQVIMKPSLHNMQDLYLKSLAAFNISLETHDIRFVEDNWENPTLGAYGVGWEVWLNGMEITQFTYFQQIGSLKCKPITGEITYGLERLAMYIQGVNNVYDIIWNNSIKKKITYGDLFYQSEIEKSQYNFLYADVEFLFYAFDQYEKEAKSLLKLKKPLPLASYECALKSIHLFNLLEARKAISVTERKNYILRIRQLTKKIAEVYYQIRQRVHVENFNIKK